MRVAKFRRGRRSLAAPTAPDSRDPPGFGRAARRRCLRSRELSFLASGHGHRLARPPDLDAGPAVPDYAWSEKLRWLRPFRFDRAKPRRWPILPPHTRRIEDVGANRLAERGP